MAQDRQRGTKSAEDRRIEQVALAAFLVNLVLAALKGGLAHLSGSLALTADAVDFATDSVASLLVWIGLRLSSRRLRSFPYGLYKIENVISVGVAIFIVLAGVEIARQAFTSAGGEPKVTPWVIGGALSGVMICYLFGWYAGREGRRTGSPTLVAESKHRQVGVLSSALVLCSLVSTYLGYPVDRYAAFAVLLFILHAAWELLSDGMRVLLDASLERETLDKIRKIILSHPGVSSIRFLNGRNAGRYRFVEAGLKLDTNDLSKAHEISHRVEDSIRSKIPHVERVMIHFEPVVRPHLRVIVPLADLDGTVSDHFGEAPYFAVVTLRRQNGRIEGQNLVSNPHTEVARGKGIQVAEWLLEYRPDVLVAREDYRHKGPGHVLSSAGVTLETTEAAMLNEALAPFRKGS